MSSTRREFIKATLGASTVWSLSAAVPELLVRSAAAAPASDDRDTVLVVVQLSGGNDGLNTLVPYEDDEYARNRSTLRLPTDKLHKIDSSLAFHPRMGAFARLYKEGYLGVVQGVGYPNQNRNHDEAMRIWHTAEPQQPDCRTGWLGRVADRACEANGANLPVAFVGPIARPFALNAERAVVPTIRSADDLVSRTLPGDSNVPSLGSGGAGLLPAGGDNHLLDYVRESTREAHAASRQVEAAVSASSGNYPQLPLAGELRTVAQLIRADLGIRVFFTELGGGGIGGFDNHANQMGNHCAMLDQLSESVAAFVDDLRREKLADRVLLMTFSEFGRTVAENGRRGTGHGAAGPVFLAGGRIKGGLFGSHPSLTDLDNGAMKPEADFRQLYATMLDGWLGLDSRAVLTGPREPLDVLDG